MCLSEKLFKLEGNKISTRPIAGTRRTGSKEENKKFEKELQTDPKEKAEHCMLVDLERNDLGRVCEYGSVKVKELMKIVEYKDVLHIESEVVGHINPQKNIWDIIQALFPGGTITGVPKIKTMDILAEEEPHSRGPYTGSLGYISASGSAEFNIIIRSILYKKNKAYVQVGGGITIDCIPEREYKETQNKAKSQLICLQ